MCAGEFPLQLCAGVVHDWTGRSLVVLVGETGSRSVIFNHWRIHDFLARGDGQTTGGKDLVNT